MPTCFGPVKGRQHIMGKNEAEEITYLIVGRNQKRKEGREREREGREGDTTPKRRRTG